jgi:UDP-2,3-diacylglucosamine pyrophosphatase LpxH
MIILFSDIHLTDTAERSTFSLKDFMRHLLAIIKSAKLKGVTDLNIVLLGDIFEILKSRKWIEADLRPWQESSPAHVETVKAIMQGIIDTNKEFFQAMMSLAKSYPECRFDYIPGNHDRPLNTPMGVSARVLLQENLPLYEKDGEEFQPIFVDHAHKLIARHGHEWDSNNRYGDKTSPFGDAIVIELIQRLPLLASQNLKMQENDPLLDFLHDLDNVRPHTLGVIAQWVYGGLEGIQAEHPRATKIIDRTFRELLCELIALTDEVDFEIFARNRHRRKIVIKSLLRLMRIVGVLRIARWIHTEDKPDFYKTYARRDFLTLGRNYKYVLCGHTHHHTVDSIDVGKKAKPKNYINTGTWRKVLPVSYSGNRRSKIASFGYLHEGCLVTIFSEEEQDAFSFLAYEVERSTIGS